MLQGQVGYAHIMVVAVAAGTSQMVHECLVLQLLKHRYNTNTAILSSFFSQQDDMRVCDEIITSGFFNT